MRCPHCQQRAMGIVAWLGHQMYQPLWREQRYHTSCRQCGTQLQPTTQEKIASFVFVTAGASMAVGARLMLPPPRPSAWPFAVIGILVGVLVQYAFARYKPVDPAVVSDLPSVRTVDTTKR